MPDDVTDHVIASSELRVHLGAYSDQTTWDGVHKRVIVCHQSNDDRLDLSPGRLASATALGYLARANGNLVANLEATFEDGSASDATL